MEYYPLEIFDDLLERNSIEKSYEEFIADGNGTGASFSNSEKTEFSFYEIDQEGKYVFFTETLESYLNKAFIIAYDHFCKNVSIQISHITSVQNQKDKIAFYLASLDRLVGLPVSEKVIYKKQVLKWIFRTKDYLFEKYPDLIPSNFLQANQELLNYDSVDYLEYKFPNNTFKDLYDKLLKLNLFTDETSYQDFRLWMTASQPHVKPKIKFACLDQEAAYIIHKIKKYFHSMKDSRIEKFNIFISNKEKQVKSNTLQRNRNAFLSNLSNTDRKNEIDSILN